MTKINLRRVQTTMKSENLACGNCTDVITGGYYYVHVNKKRYDFCSENCLKEYLALTKVKIDRFFIWKIMPPITFSFDGEVLYKGRI